jgi:hypothetical protein
MTTAREFHIRERIQGATKSSVILKGDNGEKIFVNNKVFNAIMQDQEMPIRVVTLPAHGRFLETKWIEAYIPTRIIGPLMFREDGLII